MILFLYVVVQTISLSMTTGSIVALVFFSLGAYLGINKIDFVMVAKRLLKYTGGVYFILIIVLIVMYHNGHFIPKSISKFTIFVGCVMVVGWAHSGQKNWRTKYRAFLTNSIFLLPQ